jgi:hypothetical protein
VSTANPITATVQQKMSSGISAGEWLINNRPHIGRIIRRHGSIIMLSKSPAYKYLSMKRGAHIGAGKASRPARASSPNPKLKLLDQVSEVMRFKHCSLRPETTYREWIRQFILFRGKRAVSFQKPEAQRLEQTVRRGNADPPCTRDVRAMYTPCTGRVQALYTPCTGSSLTGVGRVKAVLGRTSPRNGLPHGL